MLQKRQDLILWSPQSSDTNPYLQFVFEDFEELLELQIQSKTLQEFKLQCSQTGVDFRDLKYGKHGLPQVFFMLDEAHKLFTFEFPILAKVSFVFFFKAEKLRTSAIILFTSLSTPALNLLG